MLQATSLLLKMKCAYVLSLDQGNPFVRQQPSYLTVSPSCSEGNTYLSSLNKHCTTPVYISPGVILVMGWMGFWYWVSYPQGPMNTLTRLTRSSMAIYF